MTEFREFQKIPRLFRQVIVTEKLDGTNACVVINESGVFAQSRSRLITPEEDNFGFSAWVEKNKDELTKLGPGYHYGEWWGRGINRGYGLQEKRFSLFNEKRWGADRPACCHVVPVIGVSTPEESFSVVRQCLDILRTVGSLASPGFRNPEGVVAYHTAGNLMFKATLEKDEEWKGKKE